jgi:hypothetical protein
VLPQPVSQGIPGALREQIDRAIGLEIDQHRAVGLAASERKIIHA